MTKRPLILITNDDGVYAPGIRHLWKAMQGTELDVVVVAPASEQSAVSLSITTREPLRIEKIEWPSIEGNIWSVNGTPADCVKLALNVILTDRPQLIVSGINRGSNAGRNVFYSGTVAAVIEGVMNNIPGIAFSIGDYVNPAYGATESYISSIVHYALNHPLPAGTLLNVNFPKQMNKEFKGIRFARQGKEYWKENPEQRQHPAEGHLYYWLGSELAQFEEEKDSDIICLRNGYATAVPLHIGDLTNYYHLEEHRQTFESLVNSPAFP